MLKSKGRVSDELQYSGHYLETLQQQTNLSVRASYDNLHILSYCTFTLVLFQTRLMIGTEDNNIKNTLVITISCTFLAKFSPLPTRLHRRGRNKSKKRTSLAARHFSISKNKYTVCCSISICTKHTLAHLHSVQNTKAGGAWLIPQLGNAYDCFFFFFFLLITEKPRRRSRVAVVVDPSRHPRLRLGNVRLDFPVFVLGSFLFDPHGVVARDAVLLARALEESALRGETYQVSLGF